ncbi:BAR-domain-containing protein [Russula vinacea]|nr:BAR-domain-containing protein [Russula vinacea]
MSWQGFKKSMNRAGTTLLQKTGQIERTVDQDFASEEAKYKVCVLVLPAMSSAQLRLAETIDTFYGASDKASDSAMAAHAYRRSVEELDSGIGRELEAPYRSTILDPLGKMNLYFPTINEHISKRNKKLLDFDAARSKARKLAEKPSEDATKLPKAQQELDEAKEVFDLLNDQLVREIPILLEQRVPYFDPSFEAMIRMQCKFAEEDSVRDDYAAGQLDAQVEGVLQEMRELSIYGTG